MDVHTHFVPPEVVNEARRGHGFDGVRTERVDGEEWLVHRQGFRYPLHRSFYDLEVRVRAMDERRVDRAVVSMAPPMFMYWTEGGEATDFCRRSNDALARFTRDSGGRITAVATLPMQDPDAAASELRRAVGELGLRGAEVGPRVEDVPLDDPAVRSVLATAAELDVPLILHPYYVGSRPGLEEFYLTNLIGNPLETTICAGRLIFSGLLDEIEDLELVLMHGGGFLPYQIGRMDHGHRVRPESRGCRYDPSRYLSRFWFDTVTHAAGPLRFLVDMVGADHVVFGTDFPYDMAAGAFEEQVAGTGLDERDLAHVAGDTAARLFALETGGRTPTGAGRSAEGEGS
ncbi:MAG: amidohydrolase family protein [Nocardioidaceae bacterium]